jgi:hypothetical protein
MLQWIVVNPTKSVSSGLIGRRVSGARSQALPVQKGPDPGPGKARLFIAPA